MFLLHSHAKLDTQTIQIHSMVVQNQHFVCRTDTLYLSLHGHLIFLQFSTPKYNLWTSFLLHSWANWIQQPCKFMLVFYRIPTLCLEAILCICLSMPIQFSFNFAFQTTTSEPRFSHVHVPFGNQNSTNSLYCFTEPLLCVEKLYFVSVCPCPPNSSSILSAKLH